jgi:hypothetical protein
VFVLHVGLDLGRKRVEVCLISDQGELVDRFAAVPDGGGLYGLARRVAVYREPVRGVVESMNGARFVHDELIAHGWEVLVADAQKVKGAGAAGGQDRQVGMGSGPPPSDEMLVARSRPEPDKLTWLTRRARSPCR